MTRTLLVTYKRNFTVAAIICAMLALSGCKEDAPDGNRIKQDVKGALPAYIEIDDIETEVVKEKDEIQVSLKAEVNSKFKLYEAVNVVHGCLLVREVPSKDLLVYGKLKYTRFMDKFTLYRTEFEQQIKGKSIEEFGPNTYEFGTQKTNDVLCEIDDKVKNRLAAPPPSFKAMLREGTTLPVYVPDMRAPEITFEEYIDKLRKESSKRK